MKTRDFSYELPEELIAQDPLADRASSRLLYLDRSTGERTHTTFSDIGQFFRSGDCLVINDTRVIPARLHGVRAETGGHVEVLLLKRVETSAGDTEQNHVTWEALVRPGKKCRPGTVLSFGDGLLTGTVTEVIEEGNRLIRFDFDGIFEEILDRLGEMPLPPYITHQLEDAERYQTVYATHRGSAAAPTAGLHFTEELLAQLEASGVHIARITLHVGLGTFRPVKAEDILDHHMHAEYYEISQDAADLINRTRKAGGRIIAVGTTSCRTLESNAAPDGTITADSGWTDIFIYPGYSFRSIDGLLTNFHLPESTLIMLVSAFAGREAVLCAYEEAVRERYRFFSFGDAMLIL